MNRRPVLQMTPLDCSKQADGHMEFYHVANCWEKGEWWKGGGVVYTGEWGLVCAYLEATIAPTLSEESHRKYVQLYPHITRVLRLSCCKLHTIGFAYGGGGLATRESTCLLIKKGEPSALLTYKVMLFKNKLSRQHPLRCGFVLFDNRQSVEGLVFFSHIPILVSK